MEKPIGSVLVAFIFLTVLLSGCTPASSPVHPATETSIPSPTRWSLVVVGDSIAYNSQIACPSCYGFVTRYAHAVEKATGHPVIVQNLSQLGGIQIDGLLEELKTDAYRRDALANADIIIVAIGFNDAAWNRDDDPCDGPNGNKPDWSKYNETCAAAAVEVFRPKLESVYSQIVTLREGKPTIFRTINRYNDWIGWTDENGETNPPEATNATHVVVDAWSAMICEVAQVNGFTCADIYHAFNGSDGLTPSGDLLAKDYTHPSDKGNEVIARVLTDLGFAPLAP
jgi:lysophospholipase L1-like esterase